MMRGRGLESSVERNWEKGGKGVGMTNGLGKDWQRYWEGGLGMRFGDGNGREKLLGRYWRYSTKSIHGKRCEGE